MFRPLTRARRGLLPSKASLSMRDTCRGARGNTNPINKVAVVTGSTNGINFTIAQCLAQDGAHVVGSSRKQQKLLQQSAATAPYFGRGVSSHGRLS
ncbi:dehydrogenase/reductase SDR family member 2, mitochondrial-like [Muntiacus reevesi]|uniref:dehydrogenase/reductase SDR family member 2, mitochondrial-like n=1 Tax=Muntiacus reevesi TaxID=9886 RepID=UPI0033069DAD